MSSDASSISLANKVAIVTGSGKENGIGAGIALALARAGARVTINHVSDASASRAAQVVAKIEAAVGKGKVILVKADVSTREGTAKIVNDTLTGFGVDHIDIVVNNAGISVGGPVLQAQPEGIMNMMQVSVVGPVLLLQAAYPHMPKNSRVINIGTIASKIGMYHMPIYAAAKAAVDTLTWALSREVGRDGKQITVNTIAPGPVLTDSLPPVPQVEPVKDYLVALTRGEERLGTVEDIADAVLLIASEKSRWITGQYISASGGITGN